LEQRNQEANKLLEESKKEKDDLQTIVNESKAENETLQKTIQTVKEESQQHAEKAQQLQQTLNVSFFVDVLVVRSVIFTNCFNRMRMLKSKLLYR